MIILSILHFINSVISETNAMRREAQKRYPFVEC